MPRALRPTFRKRGEWCFSSRPLPMSPYAMHDFVDEPVTRPVRDYVVVAHPGHCPCQDKNP